jgi:hypothetical protein
MNNVESYRVIPEETVSMQEGGNINDSLSRLMRILRIFFALLQVKAFDDDFKLLKPDGTPMHQANIGELLELTQSKQDRITGLDEFVEQLIKANIDLNLIINHNIRERLRAGRERNIRPFNPDANIRNNDDDDDGNDGGDDQGNNGRTDAGNIDRNNGGNNGNNDQMNQDMRNNNGHDNDNGDDNDNGWNDGNDQNNNNIDDFFEEVDNNRPPSPAPIPPPLPPPVDHRREENIVYPNPNPNPYPDPADLPLPSSEEDIPEIIDERINTALSGNRKRRLPTSDRWVIRKRRKSCDDWDHSNSSSSDDDDQHPRSSPGPSTSRTINVQTTQAKSPERTILEPKRKVKSKTKIIKAEPEDRKPYNLRSRKNMFRGWHLV